MHAALSFLLLSCITTAALAQNCLQTAAAFQSWLDKGEPYSVATCQGVDPQKLFQQANAALLQATTNHRRDPQSALKLEALAQAAKGALEAGLHNKAKSYAQQALTLAQRDRCIESPNNKPLDPKHELNVADQVAQDFCALPAQHQYPGMSDGDAVATSTLVLGRIALLRGDVKQAEMLLLQSARITPGSTAAIFGPNMTLALELLKRQRTGAVLLFLNEWSKIWRGSNRAKLVEWTTAIRNGAIPNFGANLLF